MCSSSSPRPSTPDTHIRKKRMSMLLVLFFSSHFDPCTSTSPTSTRGRARGRARRSSSSPPPLTPAPPTNYTTRVSNHTRGGQAQCSSSSSSTPRPATDPNPQEDEHCARPLLPAPTRVPNTDRRTGHPRSEHTRGRATFARPPLYLPPPTRVPDTDRRTSIVSSSSSPTSTPLHRRAEHIRGRASAHPPLLPTHRERIRGRARLLVLLLFHPLTNDPTPRRGRAFLLVLFFSSCTFPPTKRTQKRTSNVCSSSPCSSTPTRDPNPQEDPQRAGAVKRRNSARIAGL